MNTMKKKKVTTNKEIKMHKTMHKYHIIYNIIYKIIKYENIKFVI